MGKWVLTVLKIENMKLLIPLENLIKQLLMMMQPLGHKPLMTLELRIRREKKDIARFNSCQLYPIDSVRGSIDKSVWIDNFHSLQQCLVQVYYVSSDCHI